MSKKHTRRHSCILLIREQTNENNDNFFHPADWPKFWQEHGESGAFMPAGSTVNLESNLII